MKTIIAGSRDIWDYSLVERAIDESGFDITEVVCGMAPGVDSVGWAWAYINQIPIIEVPADWNKHGKRAGPIRNYEMAVDGEQLIAVWDGSSTGTGHMIRTAFKFGLKVHILSTEG